LAALVKKAPRIKIVESISRQRRVRDVEEELVPQEPIKPFGGILTKEDADTSKTTPTDIDRTRFDRAKESLVPPISFFVN
jgi:hypothetical protein